MKPNELLNKLVETNLVEYGKFTIKMTKHQYIVTDNTVPEVYNPVFLRNMTAVAFWELTNFIGMEE